MNLPVDRFLIASALRAAADVLDADSEGNAPPKAPASERTSKARRAKKLVAPAGHADELAAQRAKQLLREYGLREVEGDE